MKSTDIDLHPRTLRRNIWRGLLSATDQEIRDGLDFYPGAHGLCRLLAMSHGKKPQQVAGIYAALSPLNTWDTNIDNIISILRDGLFASVNTTNANRDKALRIAEGEHPLDVLKGRKVTSFYLGISDPGDRYPIPVDRHLICLALGIKITSNQHLRSLSSSREIYHKVESAYRDLGRREGLGNRLASIAWFVQRRIQSNQSPIIQPGSPTCCGQPMWSHGAKIRRWYCAMCKKSRVNQKILIKRPHIDDILIDIPVIGPKTKLGFAGKSRQRPIIYLDKSNPFANSAGYQYLSRFVVQYTTGERLRPDEHVHHANGVLTDCRRDNLEVWLSERHGRFHARHQLLYMLRDRVTGRFMKSPVPSFSEQISNRHDSHSGLDDIPF